MLSQVKTRERVTDYGEVMTSDREVKAMCDLVSDECLRIDSRFLEPACGDGNFLVEILLRKLRVVTEKYRRNLYDFERHSLTALSSIYGIEILEDNVLACRERLYEIWEESYRKAVGRKRERKPVKESAQYILECNIILGNALSLCLVDENGNDTKDPIVFSQWAFVTGPMMKREDYTFRELLDYENESKKGDSGLSSEDSKDGSQLVKVYQPIEYWRLKEYG